MKPARWDELRKLIDDTDKTIGAPDAIKIPGYKIVCETRHTVHNSNNFRAQKRNSEIEGSSAGMTDLVDYQIALFRKGGHRSIVIRASCGSDTAALVKIVQMGVTDYQNMEVWRDLDRIYVGRNVPCSCSGTDGVLDIAAQ